MSKERQLPTGVDVGAELRAFAALGCERELWDSRSDDANPRKRTGLFLCVGPRDGNTLQRQLQQRADSLLGRSLPYVVTPIDRCWSRPDEICFVSEPTGKTLEQELAEKGEMGPDRAREIVRQLLEGLSQLHRRGISHGGLCPRAVVFLSDNGVPPTVAVGDVLLGVLPSCSNGQWHDVDAARYYPPEWHKTPQPPTEQTDLYMVGLILFEMLCGPPATFDDQTSPHPRQDVWNHLRTQLLNAEIPKKDRDLLRLLEELLGADGNTLSDADGALRRWSQIQRDIPWKQNKKFLAIVATALAGVGVLIGILWRQASKSYEAEIERREQEIVRLEQEARAASAEKEEIGRQRDQLRAQNEKLIERIRILEQRLGGPKGKQWWQDHVKAPVASLPDEIAKVEDQEVKTNLTDWYYGLAGIDYKWIAADAGLHALFDSARAEPWTDTLKEVKDRQKVLKTARGAWEKWADASADNIQDLRQKLAEFSGPQQDVLRDWLDEIEKGGDFRLSLIKGSTPEDSDESRLFTLSVDGTRIGESWDHAWPGGKEYAYKNSGQNADLQRTFTWKGGQSIEILLEAGRAWYAGAHRNLIDSVETHPLALWKLASGGKVSQGNNTLTFKIEPTSGRIPGPPPRKHIDADHPPILGNTQ